MKNIHLNYQKFIRKIKKISQRFKIPSKVILIVLGIFSTIWFLIRVIPKPSRASYPCMKIASPIMANFVIYLLSITGFISPSSISFLSNVKSLVRSFEGLKPVAAIFAFSKVPDSIDKRYCLLFPHPCRNQILLTYSQEHP